jgi:predicted outer membrane repeat protein
MKTIISLLGLFIIISGVSAQTTVSGNVSGAWTSAGSPYNVTGNVVVPDGETLTIGPGVHIVFQGHYQFIVHGTLSAVGTQASGILFTTDDQATGWGGIRIDSYSSIHELTYCRIEFGKVYGDYPDQHGGGLALLTANAIVSHCTFADNDASPGEGMGGAVYCYNTGSAAETMTRFIDCRFIRNQAYGEGGAIKFTSDMKTEITRCEFRGNHCLYGGGAISFYSAVDTKAAYCLFANNRTEYSNGGAIHTLGFSNSITFTNCTFSGNIAVHGDGGAIDLEYTALQLVNCILFENPSPYSPNLNIGISSSATVNYSNLPMPGAAVGEHNINQDPLFVDAANGDFTLQETSPCIDTATAWYQTGGGVTLVDLGPEDYNGTAPDMGTFEYISPLTYWEMLPLWSISIDVLDLIGKLPLD